MIKNQRAGWKKEAVGFNQKVADNLKEILISKGVSNAKLGELLGYSPQTISNMKLGNQPITLYRLARIAVYIDATLDDLLEGVLRATKEIEIKRLESQLGSIKGDK